jgi:methylthioribulose-1-phosphate dehydratase
VSDLDITPVELESAGAALARESARYSGMGWMRGSSGNLSLVLRRDPLRLAVTRSGVDKGELAAHDVVVVDEAGAVAPEEPDAAARPSAEAGLHGRIARVSGAGAVVHLHVLAPVLAARRWPGGIALRDTEMLKGLGRGAHGDEVLVPVVPNDQDMGRLGDAFERGYGAATPALVQADHGIYAWGRDLLQARHRAECLEWTVRYALAADGIDA